MKPDSRCETCFFWRRDPLNPWCGWCHEPTGDKLEGSKGRQPALKTGALTACERHRPLDPEHSELTITT